MSVFRGIDHGEFERGARAQPALEERREATRSGVLGTGTLACRRCDVPIDPGTSPLLLTELLACPFCDARGPVRDFLSLAIPHAPGTRRRESRAPGPLAPVAQRGCRSEPTLIDHPLARARSDSLRP